LDTLTLVQQRVHEYYWRDDANCATTTLKILSETLAVEVCDQVIDAALGMHGAGGYRAQCGLVEGALMFLGIAGRHGGSRTRMSWMRARTSRASSNAASGACRARSCALRDSAPTCRPTFVKASRVRRSR